MSMDPIGDMFAMLRNAVRKHHERVDLTLSGIKKEIARVLKEEGYISDFRVLAERRTKILRIFLKYTSEKAQVLQGIKRVSRPGLRIYRGSEALPKVNGGLGIAIISTSKGVMTGKQSRSQKMGGEVLGLVW